MLSLRDLNDITITISFFNPADVSRMSAYIKFSFTFGTGVIFLQDMPKDVTEISINIATECLNHIFA